MVSASLHQLTRIATIFDLKQGFGVLGEPTLTLPGV